MAISDIYANIVKTKHFTECYNEITGSKLFDINYVDNLSSNNIEFNPNELIGVNILKTRTNLAKYLYDSINTLVESKRNLINNNEMLNESIDSQFDSNGNFNIKNYFISQIFSPLGIEYKEDKNYISDEKTKTRNFDITITNLNEINSKINNKEMNEEIQKLIHLIDSLSGNQDKRDVIISGNKKELIHNYLDDILKYDEKYFENIKEDVQSSKSNRKNNIKNKVNKQREEYKESLKNLERYNDYSTFKQNLINVSRESSNVFYEMYSEYQFGFKELDGERNLVIIKESEILDESDWFERWYDLFEFDFDSDLFKDIKKFLDDFYNYEKKDIEDIKTKINSYFSFLNKNKEEVLNKEDSENIQNNLVNSIFKEKIDNLPNYSGFGTLIGYSNNNNISLFENNQNIYIYVNKSDVILDGEQNIQKGYFLKGINKNTKYKILSFIESEDNSSYSIMVENIRDDSLENIKDNFSLIVYFKNDSDKYKPSENQELSFNVSGTYNNTIKKVNRLLNRQIVNFILNYYYALFKEREIITGFLWNNVFQPNSSYIKINDIDNLFDDLEDMFKRFKPPDTDNICDESAGRYYDVLCTLKKHIDSINEFLKYGITVSVFNKDIDFSLINSNLENCESLFNISIVSALANTIQKYIKEQTCKIGNEIEKKKKNLYGSAKEEIEDFCERVKYDLLEDSIESMEGNFEGVDQIKEYFNNGNYEQAKNLIKEKVNNGEFYYFNKIENNENFQNSLKKMVDYLVNIITGVVVLLTFLEFKEKFISMIENLFAYFIDYMIANIRYNVFYICDDFYINKFNEFKSYVINNNLYEKDGIDQIDNNSSEKGIGDFFSELNFKGNEVFDSIQDFISSATEFVNNEDFREGNYKEGINSCNGDILCETSRLKDILLSRKKDLDKEFDRLRLIKKGTVELEDVINIKSFVKKALILFSYFHDYLSFLKNQNEEYFLENKDKIINNLETMSQRFYGYKRNLESNNSFDYIKNVINQPILYVNRLIDMIYNNRIDNFKSNSLNYINKSEKIMNIISKTFTDFKYKFDDSGKIKDDYIIYNFNDDGNFDSQFFDNNFKIIKVNECSKKNKNNYCKESNIDDNLFIISEFCYEINGNNYCCDTYNRDNLYDLEEKIENRNKKSDDLENTSYTDSQKCDYEVKDFESVINSIDSSSTGECEQDYVQGLGNRTIGYLVPNFKSILRFDWIAKFNSNIRRLFEDVFSKLEIPEKIYNCIINKNVDYDCSELDSLFPNLNDELNNQGFSGVERNCQQDDIVDDICEDVDSKSDEELREELKDFSNKDLENLVNNVSDSDGNSFSNNFEANMKNKSNSNSVDNDKVDDSELTDEQKNTAKNDSDSNQKIINNKNDFLKKSAMLIMNNVKEDAGNKSEDNKYKFDMFNTNSNDKNFNLNVNSLRNLCDEYNNIKDLNNNLDYPNFDKFEKEFDNQVDKAIDDLGLKNFLGNDAINEIKDNLKTSSDEIDLDDKFCI